MWSYCSVCVCSCGNSPGARCREQVAENGYVNPAMKERFWFFSSFFRHKSNQPSLMSYLNLSVTLQQGIFCRAVRSPGLTDSAVSLNVLPGMGLKYEMKKEHRDPTGTQIALMLTPSDGWGNKDRTLRNGSQPLIQSHLVSAF